VDVVIHQATRADIPVLVALVRDSFRSVAEGFHLTRSNAPTHPSNCEAAWIQRDLDRGVRYYVLSADALDVGCIALELSTSPTAYLERLGVLPEQRGKGFGSKLVDHASIAAKQDGATAASVGVIAEDIELIAWYERLGFALTSTRVFPHLPFKVAYLERRL